MSLTPDGQRVICDGAGCRAEAELPVALRPVLSQERAGANRRIDGWLFVAGRAVWRHFCPRCTPHYLESLAVPAREQESAP